MMWTRRGDAGVSEIVESGCGVIRSFAHQHGIALSRVSRKTCSRGVPFVKQYIGALGAALYLGLTIVGLCVPNSAFLPWFFTHGVNPVRARPQSLRLDRRGTTAVCATLDSDCRDVSGRRVVRTPALPLPAAGPPRSSGGLTTSGGSRATLTWDVNAGGRTGRMPRRFSAWQAVVSSRTVGPIESWAGTAILTDSA